MTKQLNHLLVLVCLCLGGQLVAQTPSWQWGIRGGGVGGTAADQEQIVDMATDKLGNLYIAAYISMPGASTSRDTGQIVHYPAFTTRPVALLVYDCQGRFKWRKIIGSRGAEAFGIGVDTLGGVYLAGQAFQSALVTPPSTQPPPVRFDVDSTIPWSNRKPNWLVKYDTSGTLQWIRWIQSDTTTNLNSIRLSNMLVWPDGRVDLPGDYPKARFGNQLSGYAVSDSAEWQILSYNRFGSITGLVRPNWRMANTPARGKFALTATGNLVMCGSQSAPSGGQDTLIIGGQKIRAAAFVAYFDKNYQAEWVRTRSVISQTNPFAGAGFAHKPAVLGDRIGVVSSASSGYAFNGASLANPVGPHQNPFMAVLDTNGNNMFVRVSGTPTAASGGDACIASGNSFYAAGYHYGKIIWDGFSTQNGDNEGNNIFLARFNATTGATEGLDSLQSSFGYNETLTAATKDRFGNVYLGGYMQQDLTVGPSYLQSIGGPSDFFVAKFGTPNCNAATVALPRVKLSGSLTAQGLPLLQWQFQGSLADLQTTTLEHSADGRDFRPLATVDGIGRYLHSTATGSQHFYRLRLLDRDGTVAHSNVVALNTNGKKALLSLSPNPAKGRMLLSAGRSLLQAQITVVDVQGRVLSRVAGQAGVLQWIGLQGFAPGSYRVLVEWPGGERESLGLRVN